MRNEKILVVEFEENSLNLLLQTLQTEGFQVVTAKDGHEGLLMFESENPDLVILEPMLLKLHGFDLCRKISKDSNKKTPVIITTGFYKGEHYKSEAIDTFGASAFFEKPFKNEDLLTTIHELLGNGTAKSVQGIKKSAKEKKPSAIDIEESVKEMEKSIKEQETTQIEQDRKSAGPVKKTGKSEITTEVDEMLKNAFSDFGLSLEGEPAEKKHKKEEAKKKSQAMDKTKEAEKMQEVEKQEEEKELKTEELIEELIQKEEESDEEEKPEIMTVTQEPEEKAEVREEKKEEKIEGKEAEADKKIFEDYFEGPDKVPVHKNLFGFLQKVKKPLPLMIGSTALVVLVAAGATYYFLRPNKSQTQSSQKNIQTISNVKRSTPNLGQQEDLSGGPALEGEAENPDENATLIDEASGAETEQESTTEFISTTGLSAGKRQVILPDGTATPESRQFEIIEEEEMSEERLGQSDVKISSPQLEETVKNIIQSENTSERIKTGDLVPVESVDVLPVATKKINPKYPPAAFQQGIEETVIFRALISEFGNVLDIAFSNPSKTAPAFKKVCDEAVRQWRFLPAKKNGVNVKVWKTFSIAFKKNKTE